MKELKCKLRPITIISFILASILQLVSICPIVLMARMIDIYIPNREYSQILLSIVIFCGTPVIVTMGYNLYQYYLMVESRKLVADVNLKCFDKLLHQPMAFFDENSSSELAQKASKDVVSYIAVWTIDIPKLLSGGLAGCVVFVALWRIHIYLALFQVFYIPISMLLMKLVGKHLEGLIQKVIEYNAKYNQQMQESFHSIRLIKANMLEQDACNKVENTQKGILKIWGRVAFFDNFVGGISNTLVPGIFYGGSFVIAVCLATAGAVSVGLLTSSLGYATKIHNVFTGIIKTYNSLQKAKGEMTVVENYMSLLDERDCKGDKKFVFKDKIVFENVTFKYPEMEQNVLEKLSFVIKKGKWTAISGASGTGKSTIIELIMRFYDINKGSIYVDGTSLEEFCIYDMRKNISYVPQVPVMMQGSIRDNLLMVKPKSTDAEIERVAMKTGILTEIQGGLDKEVGEGGMLLSGGEKQRIAIARCLLEQKQIWLLDEITSQMDTKTEEAIIELLKKEQEKYRTTIISVAHRLDFNKYADEEIVL